MSQGAGFKGVYGMVGFMNGVINGGFIPVSYPLSKPRSLGGVHGLREGGGTPPPQRPSDPFKKIGTFLSLATIDVANPVENAATDSHLEYFSERKYRKTKPETHQMDFVALVKHMKPHRWREVDCGT